MAHPMTAGAVLERWFELFFLSTVETRTAQAQGLPSRYMALHFAVYACLGNLDLASKQNAIQFVLLSQQWSIFFISPEQFSGRQHGPRGL